MENDRLEKGGIENKLERKEEIRGKRTRQRGLESRLQFKMGEVGRKGEEKEGGEGGFTGEKIDERGTLQVWNYN